MENKNNNISMTKKRVLSLICLIVFSLAFIFACLKSFLPLGKWIVGTFGIVTYPLFLFLALIELAKFLGFKYKRNAKTTIYAFILVVSLLFAMQSILTYKELDKVASFNSLKTYLEYSYQTKITLVGSFGSIFVGGLSILLGAMGTIVAFVILLTISIGLIVDYENYGKFDENIKKLSGKKTREKVNNSDKDAKDGRPNYGFTKSDSVVDSLEVDPNSLNYSNEGESQKPSYTDADVVGEISSTDDYDSSNYFDTNSTDTHTNTTKIGRTYEEQTDYHNPFRETYQSEESLDDSRRAFMSGTFGGYGSQTDNLDTNSTFDIGSNNTFDDSENEQTNDNEIGNTTAFVNNNDNIWGSNDNQNEIKIDDNVKKILSGEEADIGDFNNDNYLNSLKEPTSFELGGNQTKPFAENPAFGGVGSNTGFGTNGFGGSNDVFGGTNIGTNSGLNSGSGYGTSTDFGGGLNGQVSQETSNQNPFSGNETNIEKRNGGILSGATTPKTESQKKPVVPSGNQIPMQGVRYNPPPLSLLTKPVKDNGNYSEEQERKSRQLEEVLASFNVPAKVVNIVRGPKITRYELSMPLGVSVKKIPNYELDIQSALAAKTITIQAPIPGSNLIGIELENDTFTSVYERELFESPEFQNAKGPLPIAIGKDISGAIIVKSLAKMVHVLIAGSTGSGKSVFIHNIVLSLVYKYSPEDLRLVMVDPKRVEFGFYNGLPHLISPEVVLGTEKAVNALKWCVKEMDRRFEIMGRANYKNIEDYNKSELVKSGQFEHFPYIVIIVDELAEIMIQYKKETETALQRLTQLARACGMHLVIAVQRPSVDIITGVIKNNISSRFAFRLQSGFDSKTMLGTNGAEKLLGQGDMLMSLTDSSAMPRLQAAYASDDEIKGVVDFIKRNNPSNFDESAEKAFNSEPQSADDASADFSFADAPQSKGKVDEYFKIAVKSVMMCGSASVSYLQRRLSIGYSRAARIVDQMEEKGYIAPPTGAKQRKVLITPEQFKEDFGEDFNS